MSTRAVYFFKDADSDHAIYKHTDGYPSGALKVLTVARRLAWSGGRFEADEAAASFVTAAKLSTELSVAPDGTLAFTVPAWDTNYARHDHGGDVRLMASSSDPKNLFASCPGDMAYAYVVESKSSAGWHVTVYEAAIPAAVDVPTKKHMKKLWSGPLSKMGKWVKSQEE